MAIEFFKKLQSALTNTSVKISKALNTILGTHKIDTASLNELEESLLSSDLGVTASNKIINNLKQLSFKQALNNDTIITSITETIEQILKPCQQELKLIDNQLNVILVCGVNGNGKTTTIGKLAALYNQLKVMLAACDTFRAAAAEQLNIWTQRSNCDFFSDPAVKDPAALAYKALIVAKEKSYDILFIDTAGRLNNNTNLMSELSKITRVVKKCDATIALTTILVLDATTGQNAYQQVEQFSSACEINGLIITKLDGTAKAGTLVGIADKFKLPIYFIGIGESVNDLRPFDATSFTKVLLNISTAS